MSGTVTKKTTTEISTAIPTELQESKKQALWRLFTTDSREEYLEVPCKKDPGLVCIPLKNLTTNLGCLNQSLLKLKDPVIAFSLCDWYAKTTPRIVSNDLADCQKMILRLEEILQENHAAKSSPSPKKYLPHVVPDNAAEILQQFKLYLITSTLNSLSFPFSSASELFYLNQLTNNIATFAASALIKPLHLRVRAPQENLIDFWSDFLITRKYYWFDSEHSMLSSIFLICAFIMSQEDGHIEYPHDQESYRKDIENYCLELAKQNNQTKLILKNAMTALGIAPDLVRKISELPKTNLKKQKSFEKKMISSGHVKINLVLLETPPCLAFESPFCSAFSSDSPSTDELDTQTISSTAPSGGAGFSLKPEKDLSTACGVGSGTGDDDAVVPVPIHLELSPHIPVIPAIPAIDTGTQTENFLPDLEKKLAEEKNKFERARLYKKQIKPLEAQIKLLTAEIQKLLDQNKKFDAINTQIYGHLAQAQQEKSRHQAQLDLIKSELQAFRQTRHELEEYADELKKTYSESALQTRLTQALGEHDHTRKLAIQDKIQPVNTDLKKIKLDLAGLKTWAKTSAAEFFSPELSTSLLSQFSEFIKTREAQRKKTAMAELMIDVSRNPDHHIPAELPQPTSLFPRADGFMGAPGVGIVYTVTNEAVRVVREIHELRKANAQLAHEIHELIKANAQLVQANAAMHQNSASLGYQLHSAHLEIARLQSVIERERRTRPFQHVLHTPTRDSAGRRHDEHHPSSRGGPMPPS